MPARVGVLIAAITALALLNGWARPGWAACAAPVVDVTPTAVEPGTQIVVGGEGLMTECNDVVVCDVGGECNERRPQPVRFVEWWFEYEAAEEVLGRATRNRHLCSASLWRCVSPLRGVPSGVVETERKEWGRERHSHARIALRVDVVGPDGFAYMTFPVEEQLDGDRVRTGTLDHRIQGGVAWFAGEPEGALTGDAGIAFV